MKVSVLVPVYGVEKYIGKCAESLFSQTYKDLEYVFVNDFTPDKSIEVLQSVVSKYPERQADIKIITHDRNRGSGAARHTAMDYATGEFVVFADSDDFLPVDGIEKLVRRQEQTGADLVDGAYNSFCNNAFSNMRLPYKGSHYAELLIIQNVVSHQLWARLIRCSVFSDNNINFTEGVNQAEDYSVIPRVAFCAKRAWTDDVVYHYRIDSEGTFTDGISPKHVKSFLWANRIVADFFKDKGKKYLYPLRVGLINASCKAVRAGKSIAEVNKALNYKPVGLLFRLSVLFLSRKSTVRLARLEYLVLKRLYIWSLR